MKAISLLLATIFLFVADNATVLAQAYPSKTIRMIMPGTAGGSLREPAGQLRAERAKWGQVIKVANVTLD